MMDLAKWRVCVTGGGGFLGHYVCGRLRNRGLTEHALFVPRSCDYDLTNAADVRRMYDDCRPDVVIHLAAEVGGIGANREQPGRFFFANMAMGMQLIEEGRRRELKKFVHTSTVCAYPKNANVPFQEEDIWNGYPEETNAPYGVAKKALTVMLDGYKRQYGLDSAVVVPVNLFGPRDYFDLQLCHVIPALIRKCESARVSGADHIVCWGTGGVSREFLYVDDAAEGIVRATERIDTPTPINLGTGCEITICDLARRIANLCEFKGDIKWDAGKPDGQPRRCLDVSRARSLLDWNADMSLDDGLCRTIAWWREKRSSRRVPINQP